MVSQKLYYMVDFSASACLFEVRVNDYPVVSMNMPGQVATSMPINYAILNSGKQGISAVVLPILGEEELGQNAELKFDIKVFDVSNDFVFKRQISSYKTSNISEQKIPVIKYVNSFEAEIPYELKSWDDGTDLSTIKNCREKLENVYSEVSRMINQKKYDEFKKMIAKREKTMAISMYLSKEEAEGRINELVADFKSGFEIQPIASDAVMILGADNRVAMLKKPNGEPALFLENKETEEELMLDLAFYIPEGKTEFEVI